MLSALWWLLVLVLRDRAFSAELIAAGSETARSARRWAQIGSLLIFGHVCIAWLKGARIRDFLQPWLSAWWVLAGLWDRRRFVTSISNAVDRMLDLNVPGFFWLGLRGYLGSVCWLMLPVLLIALGPKHPAIGFIGAWALLVVLFRLPIMQVRFAQTQSMSAFMQFREASRMARSAPLLWTLAVAGLVVLAIPLYVFKVEPLPSGLWWLASLFFVAFMLPAKLIAGFVVGVAQRQNGLPTRWFRWGLHLIAIPVGALYVGWAFLTPYIGFHGVLQSLFDQHAFLLPAPLGPLQ
jgi:hypothetical protein